MKPEFLRTFTSRWTGQVALLLAWALMLGLSFPRPGIWPLAHFALVPLTLLALYGTPRRRVRWLSFVAGYFWWIWMIYWMIPVTFIGYLGLCAVEGFFITLYVAIIQLLIPHASPSAPAHRGSGGFAALRFSRIPFVLLIPILWVALEYIPGSIIVDGFPWFLIAHGQPTWFIQIADTVGAYGVSFVVAMTSGMIIDLILRRRQGVWFSWAIYLVLIGVVSFYNAQHYFGVSVDSIQSDGSAPIRVVVIQSNVPQSNKDHPAPGQERIDFDQMLALSEKAMAEKPDLIVWPETMVPRALNEESIAILERLKHTDLYYVLALEQFTARNKVNMIVGAHAFTDWHESPKGGYLFSKVFNSAFLIQPTGTDKRYFSKIHRVPFGEYMPGVESMPWAKALLLKLTPYETDYTLQPGTEFVTFEVVTRDQGRRSMGPIPPNPTSDRHSPTPFFRIATPICFEDVISDVPRRMVYGFDGKKRVDLLVNISNDGWFHGTWQGPQHEAVARFRCIENRVPMARSVNTGISSFIDSAGNVAQRVIVDGKSQEVTGFAVADLWKDGRVTLYSRIGDAPAVGCLVIALGLIASAIGVKLYRQRRGQK